GQKSRRERPRLVRARGRVAGQRLQPRPEEPAREGRHHAPATGAIGREHSYKGAADCRDSCQRQNPFRRNKMNEIIFLIEDAPEGGYTARALGHSIFTAAESMDAL